jgi:flagellar biosynthesis GTPase FlhF
MRILLKSVPCPAYNVAADEGIIGEQQARKANEMSTENDWGGFDTWAGDEEVAGDAVNSDAIAADGAVAAPVHKATLRATLNQKSNREKSRVAREQRAAEAKAKRDALAMAKQEKREARAAAKMAKQESQLAKKAQREVSAAARQELVLAKKAESEARAFARHQREAKKRKKSEENQLPLVPQDPVLTAAYKIARKSGKTDLPIPSMNSMFDGAVMNLPMEKIAVFTGVDDGTELYRKLRNIFPRLNVVNLNSEVELNRAIAIGAEIMAAGRMFMPIQVARVGADDYQCVSGRHRMVALAICHGVIDVPVIVSDMTMNEAREAVLVANKSRPTKVMEKVDQVVLGAVGGDSDAEQQTLFKSVAKSGTTSRKYAMYSVVNRRYPAAFTFGVSSTASRKNGELVTLRSIDGFWSAALPWWSGITYEEFNECLGDSVAFLNQLAQAMQAEQGFDSTNHLSAMTTVSIGKYFSACRALSMSVDVPKLASTIVGLGDIGRQKSDKTFAMICELMA